jgi:UDP-N-acetylmuramoyl-L-alanyl-D-glutamate--2,6-diaminopimelate ligase
VKNKQQHMPGIKKLLSPILPLYHWLLPRVGALWYGYPAKKLAVILVTGTKGKSSVVEIIASILKADGKKVCYTNSVHFAICGTTGDDIQKNGLRMSMPGRFFLQKFLARAVRAGCTHAVIETTSEGARYYRHHCLYPNALVVTNIAPEHIESHGSFEKYLDCKLSIVDELAKSSKQNKVLVVNTDDKYSTAFTDRLSRSPLQQNSHIRENYSADTVTQIQTYCRKDMHNLSTTDTGASFVADSTAVESKLPGEFSAYNILASLTVCRALGVAETSIQAGVVNLATIPGRAEYIYADNAEMQKNAAGEPFDVLVDYAHTAESLQALYETFAHKKIIGVFGSMGGGRDTWKRPKMGAVADMFCDTIILTDEDPCDEAPEKIVNEISAGINAHEPVVIMSRRDAIAHGISLARTSTSPTAVLITGKGTDNSIKRAGGTEEPWSDAQVALEELNKN